MSELAVNAFAELVRSAREAAARHRHMEMYREDFAKLAPMTDAEVVALWQAWDGVCVPEGISEVAIHAELCKRGLGDDFPLF